MGDDAFSKRTLATMAFLSLSVLLLLIIYYAFADESFVVFCDVGQGDAAYIRYENKYDILIDAGSSREVLECLGQYMPFYDNELEIVLISHAHFDHYGGVLQLWDRYTIDTIVVPVVENDNISYNKLLDWIEKDGIKKYIGNEEFKLHIGDNLQLESYWPPSGITQSNSDFTYAAYSDLNVSSHIFSISVHGKDILFTGDTTPAVLVELEKNEKVISKLQNMGIEILKVPHHGSVNGLTQGFLEKIQPELSVISFGENNRYNHPSPEIIEMLENGDFTYDTTAQNGHIKINF